MQLQTVLKRASAGLLVGLAMISQAQAVGSLKDDNLMCAAYMDIAVADLYPLKLIPYAKAIDKKSTQYCLKGNASYEAMANNHTKDEIVAMAVEVSNDMKKHGEK